MSMCTEDHNRSRRYYCCKATAICRTTRCSRLDRMPQHRGDDKIPKAANLNQISMYVR